MVGSMLFVLLDNTSASRLMHQLYSCQSFDTCTDTLHTILQIAHVHHTPARDAIHVAPRTPLSAPVQAALASRGITQPFSHQAQAINALLAGQHTVVATNTASGKSLCYLVPVLEALAADATACALFMFPTKALAQDQLRALRDLCEAAFGERAPCVEVGEGLGRFMVNMPRPCYCLCALMNIITVDETSAAAC